MLTQTHLVLLRAALTFFDEELSPHGASAFAPYLDGPSGEKPTAADVANLRMLLQNCQLRYVCCDAAVSRLIDDRLYGSIEAAERTLSDPDECVVTVLICTPSP